jgi:hypothetical protein
MTRRSTEQPQAVSSETDAAQVWLALLAEIIVEAVQKEDQDAHRSNAA